MTTVTDLYNNSELAMAAYAQLDWYSPTAVQFNIDALKNSGMSDQQAVDFAIKYPTILSHIPNTGSGFSATVFKTASGELSVAIRGTEPDGTYVDLLQADISEILLNGAAFHQIVDMYNWWQKSTKQSGSLVNQFEITNAGGSGTLPGAVSLYGGYWLVPAPQSLATGELFGETDLNAVNVTGHSLGGHLASAFTERSLRVGPYIVHQEV